MTVGRNDPCPCGSGRKYKKCHLAADLAAAGASRQIAASPLHDLDNRLLSEVLDYGRRKFGDEFLDEAEAIDTHPEMTMQFAGPWLAYHALIEGRPLVEWFLAERGRSLPSVERAWFAARQESWLSIWEVTAVDPGRALTLRDLLTLEERHVHEVSGSRTLQPHYALLGQVVDFDQQSLMCGMHSVPLRPLSAAEVVERMRKILRRKSAVAPEKLRNPRIATEMLHAWSEEIDRLSTPPRLQNTDGDELLLTEDRWTFDRGVRSEIGARIGSIEGAQSESEAGSVSFTFIRPGNRMHESWNNTLVGHAEVGDGTLLVSTNSIARADALRSKIEQACRSLIARHVRSHSDPAALLARQSKSPRTPAPPRERDPSLDAVQREWKERHYASWLDDSIPALGGMTPREAARTKRGREKLEVLLKDIEISESREPESARFDVRRLRQELGLLR